ICSSADILLNVSGVNPLRPWLTGIAARVLVDTDPVFMQVRHLHNPAAYELAAGHNAFFSFGENIQATAEIPDDGFQWRKTRQPIVLDQWPVTEGPRDGNFTTVMQWDSYAPAQYGGRMFGMKSVSFLPYEQLPARVAQPLQLAIANPPQELFSRGW